MKPALFIVVLLLATHSGCRSRIGICAVVDKYRDPLVTLVDISATHDSPARASVVSPFPAPLFPRNMYLAQIEGLVVVRVTIGKDGIVKDVVAIKSTQKEFEEPSVNALMRWKFIEIRDPGVKEHSGAIIDCTIKFTFKEEEPNQALEPTTTAVTPRADARVAPSVVVAHL
jgi:TonB family protein